MNFGSDKSASSSLNDSSSVLLSSTILFRHGARGPGKSEVNPWEKSHPIVNQWNDRQFEHLTDVGFHQMRILGSYYAKRCQKQNLCLPSHDNYRFYSSKENRSKLSGQEFVSSFLNSYITEVNILNINQYCHFIS
jgi:hypothetical protein